MVQWFNARIRAYVYFVDNIIQSNAIQMGFDKTMQALGLGLRPYLDKN